MVDKQQWKGGNVCFGGETPIERSHNLTRNWKAGRAEDIYEGGKGLYGGGEKNYF